MMQARDVKIGQEFYHKGQSYFRVLTPNDKELSIEPNGIEVIACILSDEQNIAYSWILANEELVV